MTNPSLFPQEITDAIDATFATTNANGTTELFVDANRTDTYLQNGTQAYPYKKVESALAIANASASALTPYVVCVAPGIYDEEVLVVAPYVKLCGSGSLTTVLKSNHLDDHFITMSPATVIRDVCLWGPTVSGMACVRVNTADARPVMSTGVSISRGHFGLLCDPSGAKAQALVQNFVFAYAGNAIHTLIHTEGFGEVFAVGSQAVGPADAIAYGCDVSGDDAIGTLQSFYHNCPGAATVGARIDGSGMLRVIGSIFEAGHIAFEAGSTGSPRIRVNGSMIHRVIGGGYAHDVAIGTASASVHFTGQMSRDRILNPHDATVNANFQNRETAYEGACALGELVVGDTHEVLPLLAYGKAAYLTGLVSGGAVTRNVSPSRVLQVAAGVGYINDPALCSPIKVTWTPGSATITANKTEYVYVDRTGTIQRSEAQPDYWTIIVLAQAVATATDIVLLTRDEIEIGHSLSRFQEFFEDVLGPISVTGGIVTASATAKKLDVSPGEFVIGISERDITGGHDVPFYYVSRDGAGGWTYTPSTVIDTSNLDTGSGPAPFPGLDHYKKDAWYVVVSSAGEVYYCVYGQTAYTDEASAILGPTPAVPDVLGHYGMRAATIVSHKADATITSVQDTRPMIGQNAPVGTVAAANHNTLTNLGAPNDDHPQYQTAAREAAAHALYSGAHVTGGDAHAHTGGGGAQIDHVNLANKGTTTHADIDSHIGSTSNPHNVTAAQAGAIATGAKGAASGVASLNGSTKVVEDPASATATPGATGVIPITSGATLDNWVSSGAAKVTPSLRAIGTGSLEACAGDDVRLSNARTPSSTLAHKASHISGADQLDDATALAHGLMTAAHFSKLDAISSDAAAATASLRTLGTTSTSACAGDDSRLNDPRTPTAHAGSHTAGADQIDDATALAHGLMTAAMVTKLAGITAGAAVASVAGTGAISSTGGTTPTISVAAATTSVPGTMSAADKTKLDGIAAGATVNVFGNDYQSAESLGRSTWNTNTSFQSKVALTTGAVTGTYRIEWMFVLDNSATNQQVEGQLYNVTDVAIVGGLSVMRPANAVERKHVCGFADVTMSGVAKTFQIQYRTANTGATVGIAEARIKFYRIS